MMDRALQEERLIELAAEMVSDGYDEDDILAEMEAMTEDWPGYWPAATLKRLLAIGVMRAGITDD